MFYATQCKWTELNESPVVLQSASFVMDVNRLLQLVTPLNIFFSEKAVLYYVEQK